MKKLLAMMLAFVMVLSLVPMVSLGDDEREGISSNTTYGDYKLSITYSNLELTESGSERKITRSFTVTNIGEAVKCKSKSDGNRIKFHIFNTNDKTLKEDFPDVTLPQKSENVDGNVKYSVVSVEKSGGGKIEIKTNDIYIYLKDDAVPDGEGNYTYFDKNETITLNLEYIIKPGDYDKTLVNFIGIYLPGIDEYNFGGAVGAEADGTAGNPVTGVTYHLNIPKDAYHEGISNWHTDYVSSPTGETNDFVYQSNETEVYDLRDVPEFTFQKDATTTVTVKKSEEVKPSNPIEAYYQGMLDASNNESRYYFAGWSTTKEGTDIKYPVVYIKNDNSLIGIRSIYPHRDSDADPKFDPTVLIDKYTEPAGTELYAVWVKSDIAGHMGYVMSIEDAYFNTSADNTTVFTSKDIPARSFKFNGYGKKNLMYKYIDLDSSLKDGDEYTVTMSVPTYTKNTTNKQKVFAAWEVKEVEPDKNTNYIAVGGQTVKFYGAQGIFSLDAIWATTTAPNDQTVSYTGSAQTPKFEDLTTTFENSVVNFTPDDTKESRSKFITYKIEAFKDETSVGGAKTVESKDLADTTKLPSVTEPGVYTYKVTAHYKVPDTTNSGATEVNSVNTIDRDLGTVSFTFTVVPTLTVNVTKELKGRGWDSDTFSFNVTATNDATVTGSPVSVNNETTPGTATVSFVKGDGTVVTSSTITITETPAGETGMTYARDKTLSVTLAKDSDGKYTISCSDLTLTSNGIGNYTADVTMTNTLETGSLLIKKDVPNIENDSTDFDFKVKFENWTKQPATLHTTGSATFTADTDGFTFTLRDGESVMIEGIPEGVKYTVTEEKQSGYTTAPFNGTGTITGGKTSAVSVENFKTGSLTVKKELEDTSGEVSGREFNFTVTVHGTAGIGVYPVTVGKGGSTSTETSPASGRDYTFSLKHGESYTISGLPVGVSYDVVENLNSSDQYHFTYTVDGAAQGSVSDGETSVTFKNTYSKAKYNTGALTLIKMIEGTTNDLSFTFKVTYTKPDSADATINDLWDEFFTTEGLSDAGGVYSKEYTVTLNTPVQIKDIPVGTHYTVEEVGRDPKYVRPAVNPLDGTETGFAIDEANGTVSGMINEEFEDDTVYMYNQYLADLTIEKKVTTTGSGKAPEGDVYYVFEIEFGGQNYEGVKKTFSDSDGEHLNPEFVNDKLEIRLKKDGQAVFPGVDVGTTTFKITELRVEDEDRHILAENLGDTITYSINNSGDKNDITGTKSTGILSFNEKTTVTITNDYNKPYTGRLTIEKSVDGTGTPATPQDYVFEVRNKDTGRLVGTVTINGSGAQTITVDVGTYTVTETSTGSFKTTVDGVEKNFAEVTVTEAGASVEFINTYTYIAPPPPDNGLNGGDQNGGGDGGSTEGSGDKGDDGYKVPDILDADSHYAYAVGDTSGLILPNNTITRKEIVAILFRLLKEDVRMENWSQESPFTDVPDDAWYSSAVGTLYNLGYLHGTGDGKFRPDRPMTRAEITALVASFFADSQADGELPFDDVDGDAWYADYIRTAFEIGLVEGNGDGTFEPDDTLTRAEAMTAFNKLLDRHPNKDALLEGMIEWPDNMDTSAWYYAQIQEATNSHTCGDKWTGEDGEIYERWDALTKNRDWRGIAWENVPNYEE